MLHPSTLQFLSKLKKHNNKPWFDDHRDQYLAAKEDFENFVQQIIAGYSQVDPAFINLRVKDCVFRIYRDVRFSKDKTPYKTHFAAGLNRGGKRVHYPGFYFHIEPGNNSYCGGGIWRPAAEELAKVRQEIDYNYDEFLSIIGDRKFRRIFGSLEESDKLVRPPKGYDEGNPAMEYLKLKSFHAGTNFADEELTDRRLVKKVMDTFKTMKPFIDFLGRAIE